MHLGQMLKKQPSQGIQMFIMSIVFLIIAIIVFFISRLLPEDKTKGYIASVILSAVALVSFAFSMFVTVPASYIGIVTTFGKVEQAHISEGAHFVLPWAKVTNMYLGQQQAKAARSEAGSKDLQSVFAELAVNYTIDPKRARDLYLVNPTLSYNGLIVEPAIYEVFKAVVARYTAEELVTKRSEVSETITKSLQYRLGGYHIIIQNVNLLNFGFSKAFNSAIEEKVTASQKAATAQRNLERVKFEAESRIAQAEGEAKAIQIQAAAVEKQGGNGYIQLQAIQKWDGKLPQYMSSGSAVPFVNVK